MPLPLTGLLVVCALAGAASSQVYCTADVYHGMVSCGQVPAPAQVPGEVRRKSECLPGEVDQLLALRLPGYLHDVFGANRIKITHHEAAQEQK